MTSKIPSALRPLFDTTDPGNLVTYDRTNDLYQSILALHPGLPEVKNYTALLEDFLGANESAGTPDRPLGPSKIANAKTAMVTTVIELYGQHARGGKRWLAAELAKAQARILELEASNRALGAALARKGSAA